MEGLFDILVILGIVITVIQRFKKAADRQKAQSPSSSKNTGPAMRQVPPDPFAPKSWKAIFEDVLQDVTQGAAPASAPTPAPAAYHPLQPLTEGMSSFMEGISSDGSRPSLEGTDTCDPDLGHTRRSSWETEARADKAASLSPSPASASAWSLSFSPDALVQGIIMSEVLARPGQRKWSRR